MKLEFKTNETKVKVQVFLVFRAQIAKTIFWPQTPNLAVLGKNFLDVKLHEILHIKVLSKFE